MLQSTLRVRNFCWQRGSFAPSVNDTAPAELAEWTGPFSLAVVGPQGRVTLARDRLGINKLFFAIHETGRVAGANYLVDLVGQGIPCEAIYSVPAGHVVEVDVGDRAVSSSRFAGTDPVPQPGGAGVKDIARGIRRDLEGWFARLAEQFTGRRICVCLSGGLDSGVIAALAREYFRDVTAYTYGYMEAGAVHSEDVRYAERLAHALRIPFRLVAASAEDVHAAVDDAVCYGQDWRDFNVHCAIVNEILARAIRRDAEDSGAGLSPLILTGDLANEFLADYAAVSYRGREYYRLPRLSPGELRSVLIQGLDAGDREVGVFNHHGLEVIQPYGLVVDRYLALPGSFLGRARAKQALGGAIAGDLLPRFVFDRVKVRAQIGSSTEPTGILPVLIDAGFDAGRLREVFCRLFKVEDQAFLSRFVRAGRYRAMNQFPLKETWIDGYLAA